MVQEGTYMKNFNLFLRDDLQVPGMVIPKIGQMLSEGLKRALKRTQNKVCKLFGLFRFFYKPFEMNKTQKNIL